VAVRKGEKVRPAFSIPVIVLDQIEQAVADVGFGLVTLIVQDSKIIQIEKLDKIRIGDKRVIVAAVESNPLLRTKITEAMLGMDYGQITIVIQNKRVVQIERTEKQRVNSLEGLYGDGI
jgi:hypothetical protein